MKAQNATQSFRNKKEGQMSKKELIEILVKGWPGEIVARTEAKVFTGGAVSSGTVANCESSKGKVPGRFTLGRRAAYPKKEFATWLVKHFFKSDEA